MQKLIRRRPSPAMVLALVALTAALSGTAIALPGTNSVQSNDIKRNAVTSSKIKSSAVTGSDIKSSAVSTSDVKNNSLTGTDITESKLGKVPSASAADAATTAGTSAETARLRRWSTAAMAEGANQAVLSSGGFTLTAACVAAGANTELQYIANGPADFFAEGEDDEDFGVAVIINESTNDAAGGTPDLLDTEDGGWAAGIRSSGLRITGLLSGIADAATQSCVAWGYGTLVN